MKRKCEVPSELYQKLHLWKTSGDARENIAGRIEVTQGAAARFQLTSDSTVI